VSSGLNPGTSARKSGYCAQGISSLGARRLASPRVCLLCLSAIADDPRVRKQGNLLHNAGFDVVGVGMPGATARSPEWPILVPRFAAAATPLAKIAKLVADPVRYGRYLASLGLRPLARWSRAVAEWLYLSRPVFRMLFETAQAVRADIYVANDWNMLPIASCLAAIHGGHYVYDSHEYASEELPESIAWRVFDRPLAVRIERANIRGARLVSTVSMGIAEQLMGDHNLSARPLVLRNVPEVQVISGAPSPLRDSGDLVVLFHGRITEHRGVHTIVESVRLWNPGRRLVLRGPIGTPYRRRLEAIIDRYGLHDRVAIEPPVPFDRLLQSAATADVGIISLPDTSAENRFALPNKIFEYMGAGLALLVPQLKECASIVKQYENGIVFTRLSPDDVAAAVNKLDMARINAFKRKSRLAAAELVWEREAEAWVEYLTSLVPSAGS
jgi:glycosyltransferase involved in cell wall biosynthesis